MARHIRRQTLAWPALFLLVLCFAVLSIRAAGDWSPPLNLSTSAVHTEGASIAADSMGRIHVVWSEGGEILHRFWDGAAWSPAAYVASGTWPDLAGDADGGVHLVFANRFDANDDIYFTSWQPAVGWDLPLNLSEGAGVSTSPRLAIAPDHSVAVVWSAQSAGRDLIYLARSTSGSLWASAPIPNAHGTHPVVAFAAAGDLLVAWQEPYDDLGSPTEVFFSQQTGSQWTLPVDVSASPDTDSCLPSLAVGRGGAHLAWQETGPEGQAVYQSRMTPGEWSAPQRRSGSTEALAPAMGFDLSGEGHVVWAAESAVQYVIWSPSTGIWQPIEDITAGQVGTSHARIALQSSAHVIWLAEASVDNHDVYYSTQVVVEPSPTPRATQTTSATPTRGGTETPTVTATPTVEARWSLFLPCIVVSSSSMP
jgi:hypothetical protein